MKIPSSLWISLLILVPLAVNYYLAVEGRKNNVPEDRALLACILFTLFWAILWITTDLIF